MKDWELTEESLNLFLSWLSPDREAAGRKYESIRRRLIVLLDSRGCSQSEELADESINRFICRLPEMIDTYEGDPVPYLCRIARNLHLEVIDNEPLPLPEALDQLRSDERVSDERKELMHDCLEECLGRLESKSRELLLSYYQKDKQAKIDFRKTLAESMGIAANALRIKMHRLRSTLHLCMNECVGLKLR